MVGTAYEDMGEGELPLVQSNVVELFSHITPEQMADFQGIRQPNRPYFTMGQRQ